MRSARAVAARASSVANAASSVADALAGVDAASRGAGAARARRDARWSGGARTSLDAREGGAGARGAGSALRDRYRERCVVRAREHGLRVSALESDARARDALRACARLRRALGEDVYVVGGAVRDWVSGARVRDVDLVTRASREAIARAERGVVWVGKRFPVALVRAGDGRVELASFGASASARGRDFEGEGTDEEVGDGLTASGEVDYDEMLRRRRAARGASKSAATKRVDDDDMARLMECEDNARDRDFTVNSMFYDPLRNEILDFKGGINDTLARVVRTVKPTFMSLKEDPVRMLRAIRLAARHGYTMTKELRAGLRAYAPTLVRDSPRRVAQEVETLMQNGYSESTFKLLWHSLLMEYTFPVQYEFLLPRLPRKSSLTYEMDISMAKDFDGGARALFDALRAYDELTSDGENCERAIEPSSAQWLAIIAAPVAMHAISKDGARPTLPPRWRDVNEAEREDARARWNAFTNAILNVFESMIERSSSDGNTSDRKAVALLERSNCVGALALLLAHGPVFGDVDHAVRFIDATFESTEDEGARILAFVRSKKRGVDDRRQNRSDANAVRACLERAYEKTPQTSQM